MEDDIVEESANEEEQLESDFSEIEVGDCFVALDNEKQCVDKCMDVDNVLQDVIASLCEGDNSGSENDNIQCQLVANAEVIKSSSLLHQFMTEHGYNEKFLYAFDVCTYTINLCIAEYECQTMLDEFFK